MHHSDPYLSYYLNQAGSGVGQVYAGAPYQKGHGVGSFMSSILRSIMPLFKSGAKHVGSELLKTGANVLNDMAVNNATPKESLRKRAREAGQNLSSKLSAKLAKMSGGSYKRPRLSSKAHLLTRPGPRQNKKKARKAKPKRKVNKLKNKKVRDIFS